MIRDPERSIKYLVQMADKSKAIYFCEFDPKKMIGKNISVHFRDNAGKHKCKMARLESIIEEITGPLSKVKL